MPKTEDSIDHKYLGAPRYRRRSSSYDKDDFEQPDFGTTPIFIAYRELIERIVTKYHNTHKRASKPRPAIRLARIHHLLGDKVNRSWTLYAIEKSKLIEIVEGTAHIWVRMSEAKEPVNHKISNESVFVANNLKKKAMAAMPTTMWEVRR
jgi:hypothetical protein